MKNMALKNNHVSGSQITTVSNFNGQNECNSSSKLTPMQIRCKFGQLGPNKAQFNSPHGFCLGVDEDIVVADTNNHRIQVFISLSSQEI